MKGSSSVKSGEQAIGTGIDTGANNGNGQEYNDTIDFFYKSQGLQPLFSHFEVSFPFPWHFTLIYFRFIPRKTVFLCETTLKD